MYTPRKRRCVTPHDELAAIELHVLAYGLLRGAERVAGEIVAEDRGPLALLLNFISLNEEATCRRTNAEHVEVIVRDKFVRVFL